MKAFVSVFVGMIAVFLAVSCQDYWTVQFEWWMGGERLAEEMGRPYLWLFCLLLHLLARVRIWYCDAFISTVVFPYFQGWVKTTYKKFFSFTRSLAIFIFHDETNLQMIYIKMASGCSSSVSFFDCTVFITYSTGDQKIRQQYYSWDFLPFNCQDSQDAVFQGFAFKIKI